MRWWRRRERPLAAAEHAALERQLMAVLRPTSLPADRAAQIRAALLAAPAPRRSIVTWWVPCAAALVAVAIAAAWRGSGLRLEAARDSEAPSGFEQVAVDLHERAVNVTVAELATSSAAEARTWGRGTTGVDVSLPAWRPPEDTGTFTVVRAEALRYRGAPALAVRYTVDARPVTLLAARSEDVPDEAPEWTLRGKRVRTRMLRGHRVLTWANAGQAYALVSDLPQGGVRACLVCHTQPARREAIERLGR